MNVIPFDGKRSRRDQARVNALAQMARRLQGEREEAMESVERLLRETPRDEWIRLVERRALHNCGAIERLSAEVSSRLEIAPLDALTLSAIEASIAEAIGPRVYPAITRAQIRATAWKDRAQALSYVGLQTEALDAAARAESLLEPFGSVAHDRAIVRVMKAMVLRKLSRESECIALLQECRSVFFDHGDARRHLDCGMAEGDLLFRQAAYAKARDVYSSLFNVARAIPDPDALNRLHHSIGHCSERLGETTVAVMHFANTSPKGGA